MASNGKLAFAWERAHVSAAISTGLTAIGLSQRQKESVSSDPVRSFLGQLKGDLGRKSLKTNFKLGIEIVVGFIRDALNEVRMPIAPSASILHREITRGQGRLAMSLRLSFIARLLRRKYHTCSRRCLS